MTGLRITAAICTYERDTRLEAALQSVLAQEPPEGGYSVMVVDNSEGGEAAAALSRRFQDEGGLRVVHEPRAGLANARNAALAACDSELIAFIDDDAVAGRDWLRAIVSAYESCGARTAVVGGPVRPRWEAPRPAWLPDAALGYLSLLDLGPERREVVGREWLAGTNIAFRVESLAAKGGFDTRLGRDGRGSGLLGNEDADALWRVRAGGGLSVYEPRAVVEHVIGAERLTQAWFRRRVAWQAASELAAGTWDREYGANTWREVKAYLKTRPRWRRSIRTLGSETDDPEEFMLQLRAIFLLTGELLEGLPASR